MRSVKWLLSLMVATAMTQSAAPTLAADAPQRYLFVVFADPQPGKEAGFEAWYDNHFTEILRLPGFVSAQRYVEQPIAGRAKSPHRYFMIYEIEGDPATILAAIPPAVQDGRITRSDPAIVVQQPPSYVFLPAGPRVLAKGKPATGR